MRRTPEIYRALPLLLYLSGVAQRRIGKLLGVSDVAVLYWLRAMAATLGHLPAPEGDEIIVEIDERCMFIGSVEEFI